MLNDLMITSLRGQVSPLLTSRACVEKHPQHTLQTRLFTFGGALMLSIFNGPDVLSERCPRCFRCKFDKRYKQNTYHSSLLSKLTHML